MKRRNNWFWPIYQIINGLLIGPYANHIDDQTFEKYREPGLKRVKDLEVFVDKASGWLHINWPDGKGDYDRDKGQIAGVTCQYFENPNKPIIPAIAYCPKKCPKIDSCVGKRKECDFDWDTYNESLS